MAYRRSYRTRRFKRRRVTRKGVSRIVKRVVDRRLEHKWLELPITLNPIVNTWTFQSACVGTGFVQGTSANTRVGDKITVQKIVFDVFITPVSGASVGVAGSSCRIILYHNKMAVGALPAAAQMFSANNFRSPRAPDFLNRLSILKDYTHAMVVTSSNAGTTTYSSGPPIYFRWTIYPKKTLQFTANNGNIGDLLKDDYGIAMCADTAACCAIQATSQMYFTDA